ncbi:MAG: polyphosphate kinase 1 [Spirochaetota bacterium]
METSRKTEFAPEHYINRELSWLRFNERVLEEALDESNPMLERLRFLLITENNLDEFFMVRVAGLKQKLFNDIDAENADGMQVHEVLKQISVAVATYYESAYGLLDRVLMPLFRERGVQIVTSDELSAEETGKARRYFDSEIFPILTPLAVDIGHPFPRLANRSANLAVTLKRKGKEDSPEFFAVVQIPSLLPRLFLLAENEQQRRYIFLEDIIRMFSHRLFKGFDVSEIHSFRLTRDSDLVIEEDEGESLMKVIQLELRRREKGAAVRLEVRQTMPERILHRLMQALDLGRDDIYAVSGRLPMYSYKALLDDPLVAGDCFKVFTPVSPIKYDSPDDLFAQIRRDDVLLHHPFHSFALVEDLLEAASEDPTVLGIKITLYRTGTRSRIVDALMRAARNGKQVTALVELRARFDEETNIQWAKRMEEEGVHVVYGLIGYKTHCKIALIVRKEASKIVRYVHMSTGNYNSATARLYTDLSLMTVDKDIAQDATHLFNSITGYSKLPAMQKLATSPGNLKSTVIKLIRAEKELAKAGKKGRLIAKMNSLVDPEVIDELYLASQAGVQIDLIVRGICCLRPGVPGISENIRVRSIIGRLLEHSRILVAQNGGDPKIYLMSADWMPRNFVRRVEIAFPIENKAIRETMLKQILQRYLDDTDSARILQADGTYRRIRELGSEGLNAQRTFIAESRSGVEEKPASGKKLHKKAKRPAPGK